MKECSFHNNTALSGGISSGTVSISHSLIIIDKCIFMDNSGDWGAAFTCQDCNAFIKQSQFLNNSAAWGAAIYFQSFHEIANVTISDCLMERNTVSSGGGAICAYSNFNAIIKNSKFISNKADDGGAMWIEQNYYRRSNFTIKNSVIITLHYIMIDLIRFICIFLLKKICIFL